MDDDTLTALLAEVYAGAPWVGLPRIMREVRDPGAPSQITFAARTVRENGRSTRTRRALGNQIRFAVRTTRNAIAGAMRVEGAAAANYPNYPTKASTTSRQTTGR